jgi:hypothetical protein
MIVWSKALIAETLDVAICRVLKRLPLRRSLSRAVGLAAHVSVSTGGRGGNGRVAAGSGSLNGA